MTPENYQFLSQVREYVAANPTVAPHVAAFASEGLQLALDAAYVRAADMEVALVCAMSKRSKQMDGVLLDKLKKWNGKSAMNWTTNIEALEAAKKQHTAGDSNVG